MKKSRIFLGISALTLAVAGAFAAKSKAPSIPTYYYTQQTSGACVRFAQDRTCDASSTQNNLCTAVINTLHYQLYTSINCVTPLYTNAF